jgi:hypothetical protein
MAKSGSSNPSRKRRSRKSASDDLAVNIQMDDPLALPPVPDDMGAITIPTDDGGVVVDFNPPVDPDVDTSDHDANLATALDSFVLGRVAEDLLDGIEADDKSRSEWLNARSRGIDMLGIKLEDPKSGVGASSAPLEGMSVVRDPVMLEAVLRFQANAQGEMLPASGPVKVVDYGDSDIQSDMLAEKLEKDLNFYLTTTATEYYPDSRRMFFWTGFSGLAFKKIYRDPIKRRPVSETVDAADLIVSDAITDLRSAQRITHQISMKRSTMKRMQILGVYKDVDLLQDPVADPNEVQRKIARVQGLSAKSERPQDQPYTVYECYCELDLEGFEHKDSKGRETGLPLPYRVTIEKDSRQILEIRRNWREDDEDYQAKIPFVAFPYATGLGFYGIGLLHILGNLTNALTALTREAIDAAMFGNFPGALIAKDNARQMTNEMRVAPGAAYPIETNGKPINQVVMPLPYKEAGPGHMALIQQLRDVSQRLGGTADTPVGEGKQDAPVGTTLALIEQATKIEGAVHKALHAAQAEEFKLLCELFRDDPEALWRGNKRPALAKDVELFMAALDRCDIVPKADPNVPSHMHRVMKAQAVVQLAMNAPDMFNKQAVLSYALEMMDVDNPAELMAGPQPVAGPPPIDPIKAKELDIKQQANALKGAQIALDTQNRAKDRESQQNIEVLKLASSLAVHPTSDPIVDDQIKQLSPLMTLKPAPQPQQAGPPPIPMRPPMMPQRAPMPVPMGLGGLGRQGMSFAPPPMRRPPMQPQGFGQ